MLKVNQFPQEPIPVKQTFTITGVSDSSNAGQALMLTIDNQFKATGPVVTVDGTWRLDFVFQQAGNRHLMLELDQEQVSINLQVVTISTPVQRPHRLRFTQVPTTVHEENFSLG